MRSRPVLWLGWGWPWLVLRLWFRLVARLWRWLVLGLWWGWPWLVAWLGSWFLVLRLGWWWSLLWWWRWWRPLGFRSWLVSRLLWWGPPGWWWWPVRWPVGRLWWRWSWLVSWLWWPVAAVGSLRDDDRRWVNVERQWDWDWPRLLRRSVLADGCGLWSSITVASDGVGHRGTITVHWVFSWSSVCVGPLFRIAVGV